MPYITPGLIGLLALTPMIGLLLVIAWQDIQSHRISNKLVLIGVLLGILLNGLLPEGWGFNSAIPGAVGWEKAFMGSGIGMAVFFPLYWLRVMGAGDVKLMALVGAFLGSNDILGAILAILVMGGLMAIGFTLWSRQLGPLYQNIKLMLLTGMVKMSAGKLPDINDSLVSVGKLPYAVAISSGTFGYLIWQRI
jgi:prepilin peptidase CpaA